MSLLKPMTELPSNFYRGADVERSDDEPGASITNPTCLSNRVFQGDSVTFAITWPRIFVVFFSFFYTLLCSDCKLAFLGRGSHCYQRPSLHQGYTSNFISSLSQLTMCVKDVFYLFAKTTTTTIYLCGQGQRQVNKVR